MISSSCQGSYPILFSPPQDIILEHNLPYTNSNIMRSREISDRSIRFLRAHYHQCRNVSSTLSNGYASLYGLYKKIPSERTMRRKEWFSTRLDKFVTNSNKDLDTVPAVYAPFLKDPLKLAEEVRQLLTKDQFELALAIVRNASRKIQCVVSWNNLIGWLLKKEELKNAIHLFQEMKKRAQMPDSHTYTIIFKGCSQSSHHKQALGRVMSIYQSMLLDNSPVKLNIIHINAVLKMCAVARDFDCMLSIVAGLPTSGIRAADRVTYVTVLNALRHHLHNRHPIPVYPDSMKKRNISLVIQAQQIWKEVMKRWHNGDIWIDEELICSMGRILLASNSKAHWDEILSLIEETMGIPRQLPRFSPAQSCENISEIQVVPPPPATGDISVDPTLTKGTQPKGISAEPLTARESNFYPPPKIIGAGVFATPGQNSLSLVLDATFLLSCKAPAKKYWKIFTEEHNVTPDLNNYVAYLRILRVCRASSEVLELLKSMPQEKMVAKVFRIAMSSCVRDKNNHHAFSNSGKILEMMQRSLRIPDVKTMMRYLHLAMCLPSSTHKKLPRSNLVLSDKYLGSQILRALDRLHELFLILKSITLFEDPALDQQSDRHEFLVNLELLISRLISAHMHLIEYRMVSNELIPELRARSGELSNLKKRILKLKKSIGASPKEIKDGFAKNKRNISDDICPKSYSDSISLPRNDLITSEDYF